jgi:hypothetical protein
LGTDRIKDTDLLIDMSSSAPAPVTAELSAQAAEDSGMHIDEEGRPKFAPAKETVC